MPNCRICGDSFEFKTNTAHGPKKYCSNKCKYIGQTGDKSYRWTRVEVKCIVCGNSYYVPKNVAKKGTTKFCSYSCSGKWKSSHSKGINSALWNHVEAKCTLCGKVYIRKESQITRAANTFCSRNCSDAYFVRENTNNWRGGITPIIKKIRGMRKMVLWANGVKKRDGHKCVSSGASKVPLFAHHLIRFKKLLSEAANAYPGKALDVAANSYGPMWDLDNGVTLCDPCHKEKHKKGAK